MSIFPKLKNRFVLAPMADVTTLPFRVLCRKQGASLAYTEQLNALALAQRGSKTLKMAESSDEDKPLSLQLSGCSAKHLIEAAEVVSNYSILDINMGCPSRKVVSQGYGAALLKEKTKVKELMTKVVDAINKPVTVKMRSGFKTNEAPQIAKALEAAGVTAITIHARTQEQGYAGHADWNTIKALKDALNIPVIGNGDITSPERAFEMLEKTGCDYVMIGRAAIKNPGIFKQCIDSEKKGSYEESDKVAMLREYLALCKKYKYEETNVKMLAANFTKGMEHGAQIRDKISRSKKDEDILEIYESFMKK